MNKKFLISLLVILLTGWIAGCAYWSMNIIKNNLDSKLATDYNTDNYKEKEKLKKTNLDETSISIDSKILKSVKSNQVMYYSASQFEINTNNNLEIYYNNLKEYFDQNPEGLIQITGHTERNDNISFSKEQSKKYAEEVKKHLVSEYHMNPRNFRTIGSATSSDTDLGTEKKSRIEFSFIK